MHQNKGGTPVRRKAPQKRYDDCLQHHKKGHKGMNGKSVPANVWNLSKLSSIMMIFQLSGLCP